jgi:TPR repeat protein
MDRVFISHSTLDRTAANAICQGLEARGRDCWIAPRNIAPGSHWASEIERGVDGCAVFVLVLSRGANGSKDVINEVALASRKGKPIIQFRIETVEPAGGLAYHLGGVQWLDAVDGPVSGYLDRLVHVVDGLRGSPEDQMLRRASATLMEADELWDAGRLQEATALYRELALDGNPEACHKLGWSYLRGEGNDRNVEEAVRWFREASEAGYLVSVLNLAVILRDGLGVPADHTEHFRLLDRQSSRGHPAVQLELGLAYELGKGTPRDLARAAELYRSASDQGNLRATSNLGTLYVRGAGVSRDITRGVSLLQKAAIEGDVDAQKKMGLLLVIGHGVTPDLPKAHYWFGKAIEQGDRDAADMLSHLKKPLARWYVKLIAKKLFSSE